MPSLKPHRSLFYRCISCLLSLLLILGDPAFFIFQQSSIAHADEVDPYGFPIISGTPAGETKGEFAVSEKGSATYTLELKVPPGTNGMQPNLSVSYDSQGQDSYMGMGWSLNGLSVISRCPTTLAQDTLIDPIDFDANDKLCLDGQRLVVASGTYLGEGAEYRTENETFAKITSSGTAGSGPLSFTVQLKNGLTFVYGGISDSRVYHNNGNILIWKLSKITDQFGNYLTVNYFSDNTLAENYPTEILYSGHVSPAQSPYNRVEFQYEPRPDMTHKFISGRQLSVRKRLKKIVMYADNQPAWSYEFNYDIAPSTNRSRLTSIQQCDADNVCLLPVQFIWQDGSVGGQTGQFLGQTQDLTQAVGGDGGQEFLEWLVDINGDSLPDLIYRTYTQNEYRVLINTGNGLGSEFSWGQTQYAVGNNGKWQWFLDLNGDGLADRAYLSSGESGWNRVYVELTNSQMQGAGDTLWGTRNHGADPAVSEEQQWFVDLNGDLLPDYLYQRDYSGSHEYYAMLNTGSGFAPEVLWGIRQAQGGDPKQWIIDVNNDGLSDIVYHIDGISLKVMLTLPTGGFGSVQTWGNISHGISYAHEPAFTDLNGDSLPDFIFLAGGLPYNYYAKINTGSALGPDVFWGTVPYEHSGRVWFLDVNGDGLGDLLYDRYGTSPLQTRVMLTQPQGGFGSDQLWATRQNYGMWKEWFIDLNGDGLIDDVYHRAQTHNYEARFNNGPIPDLITQITHGNGSETVVNYSPLTNPAVYTRDTGNIFPALNLIGPMYVVSSYQTSDGIGSTATTGYHYYGLKTETRGRGMCGFRKIDITDQATGITTTTTYRQNFPYKTLPLQKEVRLSNGTLLSRETNTWASDLETSIPGNYFVFQDSSTQEKYDLQGNLLYTVTTDKDYDSFGNVLSLHITRSDGWNETTSNTYANNTSTWHLGRLTNSNVLKYSTHHPSQTRQSSFTYSPATGALLSETIEPGHPSLELTKFYTYDVYGNTLTQTTSGPGIETRVQSTAYDSRGQFPVSSTNALGQAGLTTYSNKFGTILSKTDPNGLTASFEYDGFGRVKYEHRPDGTHKRTLYLLTETVPASSAYHVQVDETGRAPLVVHYDMLDREIRQHVLGFNGQWIYVNKDYDALGRIQRVSEPYFLGASNDLWTENQYDVVGRVTQITSPGNRVTTFVYDGLTSATTNPLNQTSQKTVNSLGKAVSVTDHNNNSIIYDYDNFGNVLTLTDPMGNVTSMQYDVRGNRISLSDPDAGTTTFVYDALGQLASQTDAKGQTIGFIYDKLGRMRQRNSAQGIATWDYDNGPNAIGRLTQAVSETGQSQALSYDSVGRLDQTAVNISEVGFSGSITRSFDAAGRLASLTYPTGFTVNYLYNPRGYLEKVARADTGHVLWQANVQNPRGQLEQFNLGNGLVSSRTFDATTGFLTRIQTGSVQDLEFTFDAIGNLEQRKDLLNNLTEDFEYDDINRLTRAQVVGQPAVDVTYDDIGNITSMTGVGTYTYGVGAGPHAVTSIAGTLANQYFYDLNGNLIADNASTVQYDAFNKTTRIDETAKQVQFAYDADHNLYYQNNILSGIMTGGPIASGGTAGSGGVSVIFSGGSYQISSARVVSTYAPLVLFPRMFNKKKIYMGGLFEREYAGASQKNLCYLKAGDAVFGIYVTETNQPEKVLYLHKDHLGSVQSITDQNGSIVETQSYDAWGNRRNPLTWTPMANVVSQIDRGFTGHEHLALGSLINMGGRIYSPKIGRFLTPDPYVQAPENLQNLNRYSYVLNNPLSYTDPNGFFFKKLFKALKSLLSNPASLVILAVSIYSGAE